MSRHMTERTTVRLPEDLLARAKRKAAAEGRTLTSLIEDGLRLIVSQGRKPERRRRVALPVSKATGGFKVDLTSFSAIQELEDLEYLEHMKRLDDPARR
jgi:hypothetical protein